jgi:hypothetical protein
MKGWGRSHSGVSSTPLWGKGAARSFFSGLTIQEGSEQQLEEGGRVGCF